MSTLKEKFVCPKCGSGYVLVKRKFYFDQPVTGLLTRQLLSVSLGKKKMILRCAACEHEWKPFEEE